MQWLNLCSQIVRHRRAGRLVFLIQIIAKGLAFGIEHHRHMGRRIGLDQVAQHVDDPEHRSGGFATGVGQRWQRVKCPKQIGRSINQDQRGRVGHGLYPEWLTCSERGRTGYQLQLHQRALYPLPALFMKTTGGSTCGLLQIPGATQRSADRNLNQQKSLIAKA